LANIHFRKYLLSLFYHFNLYIVAFAFTSVSYYPWRWIYSYNNKERSYEFAVAKEKDWKLKNTEE
jgi:hypothetical protein